MIKLPYRDLLPYLGATHHWPLNTTNPFATEVIGGADLGMSNAASMAANNYAMFEHAPETYVAHTATYEYAATSVTGVATHVTNAGITSWSLNFWFATIPGGQYMDILADLAGENYYRPSSPGNYGHMITLIFDETTTNMDIWVDDYFWKTAETGVTATKYSSIPLFENRDALAAGHVAFFPKAITANDIKTLYDQRKFLGKFLGTATVDGAGAPALIRSYNRADGRLAGETTAASDGTYELWVVEPVEQDIIAIPPDGFAARPLAHGPILPINGN